MDDKALIQKARDTLHDATALTAHEAVNNISIGIDVIKAHTQQPKTLQWRNQFSWLMGCVRNEALNGIDALSVLNPNSNVKSQKKEIRQGHLSAQKALFSHDSPQRGALALVQTSFLDDASDAPSPLSKYLNTCHSVRDLIQDSIESQGVNQVQSQRSEQGSFTPSKRSSQMTNS